MTRKPNLALNAEIGSSGRAANSARCARAISFALPQPRSSRDCGSRDVSRMMGRTLAAVSSTTRPISSLAQIEANLNAAGPLERYQYCQTSSNDCFSNNAPEASHDRHSRNLQVITGRAAREGARERAKTNRRDEKMALRATQQPRRGGTTSCASRPSAGIDRANCLISLKAAGEQEAFLSTVGRAARVGRDPEG